jgi:hypothetical protein
VFPEVARALAAAAAAALPSKKLLSWSATNGGAVAQERLFPFLGTAAVAAESPGGHLLP